MPPAEIFKPYPVGRPEKRGVKNNSYFCMEPIFLLMRKVLIFLLFLFPAGVTAQTVLYDISNTAVYAFLEEMAAEHLITVTSEAKPWSRMYIAERLQALQEQEDRLTPRQKKELAFYLRDFNKELRPEGEYKKRFDLIRYQDSLFTIAANIILGVEYWHNGNGGVYHRWNGAQAFAYVGEHWGFQASLRDNHDSRKIRDPRYLQQLPASNYKGDNDFSEMRGGVFYSWKWGHFGLVKDNFAWGDGRAGANIFGGRTPSFVRLDLLISPARWIEFRYTHGWLASMVVDSSRSYWFQDGDHMTYRKYYMPKYLAANLYTVKPWPRLHIYFGNSIIYDYAGPFPAYLIPFVFFKSIDHTYSAGIDNMNAQMFLGVSSRQIRHLYLYTTLFLDEISLSRMTDPDRHSNFYSWKVGGELSNWPLRDVMFTAEYTRTNPLAYQHYVPTLTFETNRYNLGYWLEDNSEELFLALAWRPLRGFSARLSWSAARKGPDYTPLGNNGRLGLPFIEHVDWQQQLLALNLSYQIINDGYLTLGYSHRKQTGNPSYTPEFWQGTTDTWHMGINFGF